MGQGDYIYGTAGEAVERADKDAGRACEDAGRAGQDVGQQERL